MNNKKLEEIRLLQYTKFSKSEIISEFGRC